MPTADSALSIGVGATLTGYGDGTAYAGDGAAYYGFAAPAGGGGG